MTLHLDWSDFTEDSGVSDTPLLLSELSQSLILAAMQSIESRYSWLAMPDADWDDCNAAIAEAYKEIMERVEYPNMLTKFVKFRQTNTFGSFAHSDWRDIPISEVRDDSGIMSIHAPSGAMTISEAGIYKINVQLTVRNAATAQSVKHIRIRNTTTSETLAVSQTQLLAASAIFRSWSAINDTIEIASNDVLKIQIYATNSNSDIEAGAAVGGEIVPALLGELRKIL